MPRSHIQSISRAVALLDQISQGSEDGLRLSELSRHTELSLQTVQSLLRTLQDHGLVSQSARGKPYRLGPKLFELGRRWLDRHDPEEIIRNELDSLCETVNEYVIAAELHETQFVVIADAQPNQPLRVHPQRHNAHNLHTMATAKVLLAYASTDVQEYVIKQMTFSSAGPKATSSANVYRQQLKRIRKAGRAICIDEAAAGISALAVPVYDKNRNVSLALGISLPTVRLKESLPEAIFAQITAAAERLGRQLR